MIDEFYDDPLGEYDVEPQKIEPKHSEFRPCPFCGSEDIFNRDNGFEQNLTGCHKCGARIYYKFATLDDAAKAWNTRPIENKLLETLKKTLSYNDWAMPRRLYDEIKDIIAKAKVEQERSNGE